MRSRRRSVPVRRLGVALWILPVLVLSACGPPDDQRTDSLDRAAMEDVRASLPAELLEELNRGSTAYRAGDYQAALEAYETVVTMDEELAAGWFGVFMAQRALGNAEAAEDALDRARALAPGASLLRPDDDTLPPDP